jgi:hypothetical protein
MDVRVISGGAIHVSLFCAQRVVQLKTRLGKKQQFFAFFLNRCEERGVSQATIDGGR